jgi:hypothetical protein
MKPNGVNQTVEVILPAKPGEYLIGLKSQFTDVVPLNE